MKQCFDTIVKNGILVMEDCCKKASIGISDGKIVALFEDGCVYEALETFDAEGKYIFPGAIDTHTHFFEPGADYREDWFCGTKAAASGGYTCVMEMPNSSPPVIDEEGFKTKYSLAVEKSVVDFALWGGVTANNMGKLERLKELGCIAFKGFTLDAGPEYPYLGHQMQVEAMEKIKVLGSIIGFHAEDEDIVKTLTDRNKKAIEWDLKVHDASRPYYAELTSIVNALIFSQETGCPLHICHLSIPEGAEALRVAKLAGVDVTVESCSHYFLLNYEDNFNSGTYGLIQPPLRNRKRMDRMWEYLFNGTIDYLGTDHAPYTMEDKEPVDGDLWSVMGGTPSIDIVFELMLTEAVKNRGMDLVDFSKLMATNAAKRFGLYPQKGAIRLGADADLTIVDMEHEWEYSRVDTYTKSKCTKFPYEGRRLTCKVDSTFVRGVAVYQGGEITVEPGYGRFMKPEFNNR